MWGKVGNHWRLWESSQLKAMGMEEVPGRELADTHDSGPHSFARIHSNSISFRSGTHRRPSK
jgi:hypothetical protein